MHNSFSSDSLGSNPFESVWQAVDEFKSRFEKRAGGRANRGDVRAAVLALLAEAPMHGYQIIQEISERSQGAWKPSAGSVYPTLALLADEGLISSTEANGKKTYSLTEAGHEEAERAQAAQPFGSDGSASNTGTTALPKAGFELAQAAAQVGRSGSPEQVAEAVQVLKNARKKLYSLLAQG